MVELSGTRTTVPLSNRSVTQRQRLAYDPCMHPGPLWLCQASYESSFGELARCDLPAKYVVILSCEFGHKKIATPCSDHAELVIKLDPWTIGLCRLWEDGLLGVATWFTTRSISEWTESHPILAEIARNQEYLESL